MVGIRQVTLLIVTTITLGHWTNSLPTPSGPNLDRIHSSPTDNWFVDQFGRIRIFHGVNIVKKEFPWYHDYLMNDTRLDDLQRWGFNVVRLGSMWAGAEPSRGNFNISYINILEKIVKRLADRGIYTLLDMHQDCLSSRYQAHYDGVPRWLIDTFPEPTNPFPWPLSSIGAWEEKYITQAVSEGFQHFYNNVSSSLDSWANFWGKMAETFTGNPAVIGYNLINEPWIGDFYTKITRAFSGRAGAENLLPAYDKINDKIRLYDKQGILFYEPVIYGQIGHGKWTGSGFDRVPGGATYRNVSAYSFHAYCWALEFLPPGASDEERRSTRDYCYKKFLPQIMMSSARNVQLTGGARMLTEFGLCKGMNDKKINVECQFFLDLCDEHLVSWIEWDYNDYQWYTKGNPVLDKVKPHVRPYARAIAGVPKRMHFDAASRRFRLEYTAQQSIIQPTEIFLPELVYYGKVVVKVEGPARAELDSLNVLNVYNTPGGTTDNTVIITVNPQ